MAKEIKKSFTDIKKTAEFIIGIDPGTQTGIAVWCRPSQKLNELITTDFWGAIDMIDDYTDIRFRFANRDRVLIRIEDPGKNKPVFVSKAFPGQRAFGRKAQNVGMNKKEAELLIKYCERNHIWFEAVRPEGRTGQKRKWTEAEFQSITKETGRHSQHVRDAAMMVYKY